MFLLTEFKFMDFEEPPLRFFIDHATISVLAAAAGFYLKKNCGLRWERQKQPGQDARQEVSLPPVKAEGSGLVTVYTRDSDTNNGANTKKQVPGRTPAVLPKTSKDQYQSIKPSVASVSA